MLKSLHKNDTQTIPYIATKNWKLSNVANEDLILMEHSGSDGLPVAIEYLNYTPIHPIVSYAGCSLAKEQQELDKLITRSGLKTIGIFYPELDPVNPDGTYQRIIYSQIATAFYNRYHDPTKIWGLEEIDFEKSQTKRFVADRFRLFDIPQIVFGEKVLENTVILYDTTTDNNYTITDDGHCNLFAGINLFSRQQEIRHFPNDLSIGFDYFCDGYNANTASLTVLDNAVVISGSDSASFGMTLYAGSSIPQSLPDIVLGPLSVGMYSGSLATVIVTTSGSEDTASIGYSFQGGVLTTVVLTTSGSEDTASIGYSFQGGVLTTVVLLTSGSEDTSSIGYSFEGGSILTTVVINSGTDSIPDAIGTSVPGINIGLYSGSLSP